LIEIIHLLVPTIHVIVRELKFKLVLQLVTLRNVRIAGDNGEVCLLIGLLDFDILPRSLGG
jgi:hypothetical protein